MFSFKHFLISSLTFRSLIHFEFIFVCGIRKCPNFVLLHVAVQFFQHHLLVNWPCVGLLLGSLFCSTDLCDCFYASTILFWLLWFGHIVEVRVHDTSSSVLSQDCFGFSGCYVFLYKFLSYLFQSCEKCHWYFDRDYIVSVACFELYGHFNSTNSFRLFMSSSVSLISFFSFPSTSLLLSWVGLFLGILFFLMQL